jgi:hypothetical protein
MIGDHDVDSGVLELAHRFVRARATIARDDDADALS